MAKKVQPPSRKFVKKHMKAIQPEVLAADSSEDHEQDPDIDVDEDVLEAEILNSSMNDEDGHLPVLSHSDSLAPAPLERELKVPSGQDPLAIYIREITRYKLLTLDEEKALTAKLIETGDIEVAKDLVKANLRLVVKIAMEYRHAYQNILDLIQEGNIGLMKAVSKYDPTKGAKLSYYASWWIRSYILKFILDNFHLVKIGTTADQKKLFFNLIKEKERLLQLGQDVELKTLAHNLGVSEKSVALMDERIGHGPSELSLSRPLREGEVGKGTFEDLLADESIPLEEKVANEQGLEILKEHLHSFVAQLKGRDLEVFQKRLLSEVPPSLQSIADEYGVSRERIRQIEERLLQKLKVYMSEFLR